RAPSQGDLVEVGVDGRLRFRFVGRRAIGVGQPRRVLDPTGEVGEEFRLAEGFDGVPATGVPGPAAAVLMTPGDRVIVTHGPGAGIVAALVESGQHTDVLPRVLPVVVPLVGAYPLFREVRCGRMPPVLDVDRRFLDVRV